MIKYTDMLFSFSCGGFIDLLTMTYIPPRWTKDKLSISDEEYDEIETNISRYLKTPVFRTTGTVALAAMRAGMSRDELIELGMNKSEYWDVLLPNYTKETRLSLDEWRIVWRIEETVEDTMIFCHHLEAIRRSIISEWLSRYGIICED